MAETMPGRSRYGGSMPPMMIGPPQGYYTGPPPPIRLDNGGMLPPGLAPPYHSHRSKSRSRSKRHEHEDESLEERPHTIDIIGDGPETSICGHIDLLVNLPLHNQMHRQLLQTFKSKPGNYEGKYNDNRPSTASVYNYGRGYLKIHFTDDVTRPEMSEFLLGYGWKLLTASCSGENGTQVVYEKWTNVISKKLGHGGSKTPNMKRRVPTQRFY